MDKFDWVHIAREDRDRKDPGVLCVRCSRTTPDTADLDRRKYDRLHVLVGLVLWRVSCCFVVCAHIL